MKKLLIVGTGGQGKVVLDCAIKIGAYSQISFITNDLSSKKFDGYPIYYEQNIGENNKTFYNDFDEVIVAIGDNKSRLAKSHKFSYDGLQLATLIHPRAVISEFSKIREGTVVFANAVVNPFASIGLACIINTGAIVEHDCILGDGVHISPNALVAGNVTIGTESWICAGVCISNNINVGSNCIVGAGGVVLRDMPNNVLAAGIPAVIKKELK